MLAKTFLACVASALAGVAFIISCSDDAPGSADAAVCDCPAAEPPLAGRIVEREVEGELAANAVGSVVADCGPDATTLSGGCGINGGFNGVPDVFLITSRKAAGGVSQQWTCMWGNRTAEVVQVSARATCLLPPE